MPSSDNGNDEIENLIVATIRARKENDPVKSPLGWAQYARNQATQGDLSPLEPGRNLILRELKKAEADAQYKLRLATRPAEDHLAEKAGVEMFARARNRREAQPHHKSK